MSTLYKKWDIVKFKCNLSLMDKNKKYVEACIGEISCDREGISYPVNIIQCSKDCQYKRVCYFTPSLDKTKSLTKEDKLMIMKYLFTKGAKNGKRP